MSSPALAFLAGAGFASFALLAFACDPAGDRAASTEAPDQCPPCECVCKCDEDAAATSGEVAVADDEGTVPVLDPGPVQQVPTDPAAIGELVASANRKMMHDDGKGCLADLDAVAKVDPKMDARMAVTRGQCEMLVGKCQAGKARVAKWYVDEAAMTPERAAQTAEALGSMRCRGGDSTDRDALLRAHFELTDGAYMNKRTPAFCAERIKTVRELLPKVPPKDFDDSQVKGMGQALFYTSAACYARAGDCKAAYEIYADLFPKEGVDKLDAATRTKVIRESFESSVERCKP